MASVELADMKDAASPDKAGKAQKDNATGKDKGKDNKKDKGKDKEKGKDNKDSLAALEEDDDDFMPQEFYYCGPCKQPVPKEITELRRRKRREEARKKEEEDKRKKKEAKAKEKDIRKEFYFSVSDIQAQFENKLDNAFIEIVIGGYTRTIEEDAGEHKVKRKRKDANGNDVVEEVTEPNKRKRTQIVRPYAHRFYTRLKKDIKIRETVRWQAHNFTGNWYGTYKHLAMEELTINCWRRQTFGPNSLIGSAKEKLEDIAGTRVEREYNIENTSEGGRKSSTAFVTLKCVFQEAFNFQVDFRDWELEVKEEASSEDEDAEFIKDDEPEHVAVKEESEEDEEEEEEDDEKKKTDEDAKGADDKADDKTKEKEKKKNKKDKKKKAKKKKKKKKKKKGPKEKHVLDLAISNNRDSFFSDLVAGLTQCKWRSDSAAVLHMLNGHSRDHDSIYYYGTRAWLEDEQLQIRLSKQNALGIKTLIAYKDVALQGTLDHGFMLAHLDYVDKYAPLSRQALAKKEEQEKKARERREQAGPCGDCFSCMSCLPCAKEPKKEEEEDKENEDEDDLPDFKPKLKIKGVVNAVQEPAYRQAGNAGRRRGGGLFQSGPSHAQLVVKVVRAKGLQSLDEFKEILNPTVNVEFSGVRKSTGVIPANTDPFWDEELSFKIPDVQKTPPELLEDFGPVAMASSVVLAVWDEDGLVRSPLGHCVIDFPTIYNYRVEKMVYMRSTGREQKQWVYEAKKELQIPETRRKEDDHIDRKLVKTEDDEEEQGKVLTRYIEFIMYFSMGDGSKRIDRPKVSTKKNDPKKENEEKKHDDNPFNVSPYDLHDPTPMQGSQQRRALAFWNESLKMVPGFKQRFFSFMGKDEWSANIHFLSQFVKPIHPPTEIQHPERLFYFIYCIEHITKPLVDYDTLKKGSLIRRIPNVWIWADPFYLLEKKKGDVKDHALLLCNFLLGLNFDAYVCIGTARPTPGPQNSKLRPQPHVWVMTLHNVPEEEYWQKKAEAAAEAARERAKAKRAGVEYVPPKQNEQKKKKFEKPFVMFWETINGQTYRLKDEFLFKPDGRKKKKKTVKKKTFDDVDEDELDKLDRELLGIRLAPRPVEDAPVKYNDVFDEQRQSRIARVRERLSVAREILDPLKLTKSTASTAKTPYETIDVVFNHRKLYANMQEPDPERVKYDFNNKHRWMEFSKKNWSEFIHTDHVTPFYIDKPLMSQSAGEVEVKALQDEILERVKTALSSHREYAYSADTEFYEEFIYPSGVKNAEEEMQKRLAIEERLVRVEELYEQIDVDHAEEKQEEKQQERATNAELKKDIFRWRKKVLEMIDSRSQKYVEKLMLFKHNDGNRISDDIVEMCKRDDPNILALVGQQDPVYAVSVKVERLPSMVSPVRVLLFCTYVDLAKK